MRAKLIVEGREFPIEIQDPELKKLLTPKKSTGYGRVAVGDTYYFVSSIGDVMECEESGLPTDNISYDVANYYQNELIAENNARADKLMRQLRRFAVEHREKSLDWNDELTPKHYIMYSHKDGELSTNLGYRCNAFGSINFDTVETAELAIKTFHDELVWYFTEYKDSL